MEDYRSAVHEKKEMLKATLMERLNKLERENKKLEKQLKEDGINI